MEDRDYERPKRMLELGFTTTGCFHIDEEGKFYLIRNSDFWQWSTHWLKHNE